MEQLLDGFEVRLEEEVLDLEDLVRHELDEADVPVFSDRAEEKI